MYFWDDPSTEKNSCRPIMGSEFWTFLQDEKNNVFVRKKYQDLLDKHINQIPVYEYLTQYRNFKSDIEWNKRTLTHDSIT